MPYDTEELAKVIKECSAEKDAQLDDFKKLFEVHLHEENNQMQRILKTLESLENYFTDAFPENDKGEPDFHGHRQYHRKLIIQAAEREAAKQEVIRRVLGGSIWAVIVFIGLASWERILHLVHKAYVP